MKCYDYYYHQNKSRMNSTFRSCHDHSFPGCPRKGGMIEKQEFDMESFSWSHIINTY